MTRTDNPRPPFVVFDLHDVYVLARHALTDPDPGNHVLTLLPGPVPSLTSPNPPDTRNAAVAGHSPDPQRVLMVSEPVPLPLTDPCDPTRSFIAAVYRGLVYGHNWLTLSDRPSGGLDVDTFATLPSHHAHADAGHVPATLDLDVLGPFDGQILKGYSWNGWAIPAFDLPTVRAIGQAIAGQAAGPDLVTVVEIGDDATVTLVEEAGTAHEHRTVIEPDADGLYGLGAWSWCWSINTTPTLPDLAPADLRLWFPWRPARAAAEHALASSDQATVEYPAGASSSEPGLVLNITPATATLTSTGHTSPHAPPSDEHTITDRPLRLPDQPAPEHDTHAVLIPAVDIRSLAGRGIDRCAGWLVLDVWFDQPGLGGVPLVVTGQSYQRDDLDPGSVTWRPALLSCAEFAGVYAGEIADGVLSGSGALLARFDRDTVGAMVTISALDPERAGAVSVQAIGDSVQLLSTAPGEPGGDMVQMGWAPCHPNGMYLLGAHQLTWKEVTPDA
ncbi:hypothetical protein AB0M43_34995 [Longispora sp. NPDC051575]|uniref:hypothetical protein n=1 Tax=Longispora sp. NPDC051575 TaxID=3154943 RepID=UPI003427DD02